MVVCTTKVSHISRKTSVSKFTVQTLLRKYKELDTVEDRKCFGLHGIFSTADESHIMSSSLHNQKVSTAAITDGTPIYSLFWSEVVCSWRRCRREERARLRGGACECMEGAR